MANSPRRAAAPTGGLSFALLIGAVALLLYSFGVGLALMAGRIAPGAAYVWMMGVPLALAVWYGAGFVRAPGTARDSGLLVSALGWLACALCFWFLHLAAVAAVGAGLRLDQLTPSPLSWIFAALAIAGIAGGAYLSWQHWQRGA